MNTRKTRRLSASGVGQVVCLDLERERVLAWDRAADDWRELNTTDVITDASLARPLPVAALLDAGLRDDTVVAALAARRVPALEALRSEAVDEGRHALLVELVTARLGRAPSPTERAALDAHGADPELQRVLLDADASALSAWLAERIGPATR